MACSESPSAEQSSAIEVGAPRPMRWWGWGDGASAAPALGGHALRHLAETIGLAPAPLPPVALEAVRLPRSALGDPERGRLHDLLGADGLSEGHAERVRHAAGRSCLDLLRLREGTVDLAPDAVVRPRDAAQLQALLTLCGKLSVAVVPFGGGTSVVGGLEPLRGAHRAVLSVDMGGLAGVRALDRESLTLTAGAGSGLAALERWLAARGLTLGHFPQSFEHVSIGGCAATRSAGQASGGYGRFEAMVVGMRMATPSGELSAAEVPASAAGPDLRQLMIGSEGAFGAISELTLRVRRAPAGRLYEGVIFADFDAGVQALRVLAQQGAAPTIARLSEQRETQTTLALADGGGLRRRLERVYLGARGYGGGCLAILGFEGDREQVRRARRHALRVCRSHGAAALGAGVGEAWRASRFQAPYMRDELLTHGVLVETLETACVWSRIGTLRAAVTAAIETALAECGTPGIVGCHVSHLYETGASLYFTYLARRLQGDERGQLEAVKRAASEAIAAGGGTISHHHGVGRDHLPWLESEIGERGLAALAAVKAQLDPQGIMSPGRLPGVPGGAAQAMG